MTVIFLNRYFYPDHSATSQLLSDLAFHLAREGRAVRVITSRQRYDDADAALPARETVEGVLVQRVRTTRFGRGRLIGRAIDYFSFYLSAAWALLRCATPGDIVVCKTDPPLLSLAIAPVARLKHAVLVNWLQDIFPEVAVVAGLRWAGRAAGIALAKLRDRSLASAAANVVLAESMERYLRSRGIRAASLRVVPNWADGEAIKPAAAYELRAAWGLEGRFVVGYSGNMGRVHEFGTILEAARRLASEPAILFLFIGGGAQRVPLEERAQSLALPNVRFRPYQPREALGCSLAVPDVHLVTLLPGAERFVFPSKLYGALAAGRPVIYVGDPSGELAALLAAARCGTAVAVGDAEGLCAAIERLRRDEALRHAWGENARQLFEREFDRPIALRRWREILRLTDRAAP